MFYFLEGAATTGDAAQQAAGGGLLGMLPMLLIMIGVFYFMLIRPENKRKKEAEQLRSSIKNGDKITTIGGIIGTVVDVKSDSFVIETSADQVRIEFAKWALSTNETAAEAAKEEAKKKQEQKAKEKAAKRCLFPMSSGLNSHCSTLFVPLPSSFISVPQPAKV